MRNITTISFALTTHCNMACPDCVAGITRMDKADKKFYDWDYILMSAKYLYGIDRINLTGGEPSIHPKFSEWVPKLKELFGCKVLSVWTNGTMFRKKPDVWQYFDEIHCSNYTKDSYVGSPDNTADIAWIKERLKGSKTKVFSTEVEHLPFGSNGTKPCFRAYSETVEYVDGRLYGCCASSGLPTKVNIPLTDKWREEILTVYPPCHECLFAEK